MNDIEIGVQNAIWFYHTCVASFGSDAVCEEAYALGTLAAVVVVAWLVLLLARRNFRAWREMRLNEQRILARKQVAPPDVMKRLKWPGDSAGAPTLPYRELVNKIKEEQSKRRQGGSDGG